MAERYQKMSHGSNCRIVENLHGSGKCGRRFNDFIYPIWYTDLHLDGNILEIDGISPAFYEIANFAFDSPFESPYISSHRRCSASSSQGEAL